MRLPCVLGLCSVSWLVAACSDGHAAAHATAGKLVLELGGDHASLRQSLQAAGITPAPPQHLRSDAPPVEPVVSPGGGEPTPPAAPLPNEPAQPQPQPQPQPPTTREVPADEPFVYVTLGDGQTLIHLARKHLGDGNRFRDILAINGWTEADSRRLKAGQRVKIPRPAGGRRTTR